MFNLRKKMPRIVTAAILLLIFETSYSQEIMTFRQADSITYNLYLQERWGELTEKAREAVKTGYDYYYMRMRLGIALYELHNLGAAEAQFKKALEFSKEDQKALEYLFYCYYLSGRNFQAWSLVNYLTESNRQRILKESKFRNNSVTIESFYGNAETEEITFNPEKYFKNPEAGSQIVTQNFINTQVYLTHISGNKSSYFHSVTSLIKDNYLHYYDGTYYANLTLQRVIQFQYYGRMNFFSRSGWMFSPAFHVLGARYPYISISNSGMNYRATTYIVNTGGFAGGMGLTKTGGFITIAGEAVYTNLSQVRNLQGNVSLILYPAGNRSFYFGANLAGISENGDRSSDLNIIKGFIAGISIRNRIWLEFTGSSGKMKNYSENIGLIIYNSEDYLRAKYTGRIFIPFYKAGITVYAGGGWGRYSSEFIPDDGSNDIDNNILNYKSYTITGGITWNI